jgi:hypothetical protein
MKVKVGGERQKHQGAGQSCDWMRWIQAWVKVMDCNGKKVGTKV